MPEITAAMVKSLREKTDLPFMDCKRALEAAGGNEEAAITALREAGKKLMDTRKVELQCESAPVAGNDEFKQLANDLAQQLATGPGAATPDDLWGQPSPSQKGKTLRDVKDDLENKIREVFRLARIVRVDAPAGGFVHVAKIGALVEVEGGNDDLAKEVALHITAKNPRATTKDDLDPALVTKEKELQKERARKEGKPENIIEKMIEGRMGNFYAEHVLEEQPYVRDESQTVGALAKKGGMKVKRFIRWALGETPAA
jgi:elongation factor Ts